jgi:hypothetical protein
LFLESVVFSGVFVVVYRIVFYTAAMPNLNFHSPSADNTVGVGVFVHNVSHWNVLVSLQCGTQEPVLARIRFHDVSRVTALLGRIVKSKLANDKDAFSNNNNNDLDSKLNTNNNRTPYGFDLSADPCKLQGETYKAFHVRRDMQDHVDVNETPVCVGIWFPLAAVILPRWLAEVNETLPDCAKQFYMMCGSAEPFDNVDSAGNDTKNLGELLKIFCSVYYPSVHSHIIHAPLSVFHYDANVAFVNEELKPRIEEWRLQLAIKHGEDWPMLLDVSFALTDGASARVSAITASLKVFRPTCLHMWNLKRFWREFPSISYEKGHQDVEVHSFETLQVNPPKRYVFTVLSFIFYLLSFVFCLLSFVIILSCLPICLCRIYMSQDCQVTRTHSSIST